MRKTVPVRVESAKNPGVTEIRNRGARERVSVMQAASPLSAPGSTAYVLVFANSSAHAVATPELGSLPFRGVAHPPASMNCR